MEIDNINEDAFNYKAYHQDIDAIMTLHNKIESFLKGDDISIDSIKSILTSSKELTYSIYEIIWIESLNLKHQTINKERKNKFLSLTSSLLSSNLISRDVLIEKLDENILANLELIEDEKIIQNKMKLLSTKLFFQQEKFNLLREESEGFSKLVYIIYETEFDFLLIEEKIIDLIGYFDLDPNKVSDIILDYIIADLSKDSKKEILLKIIKRITNSSHITLILSNKAQLSSIDKTKFYNAVAFLIKNNFIHIKDALSFIPLEPNQEKDFKLGTSIDKCFNNLKFGRDIPFQEKKNLGSASVLSIGSNLLKDLNESNTIPSGTYSFIHNYSFNKIYKFYQDNNFNSGLPLPLNDKYIIMQALLKYKLKDDSIKLFNIIKDNYNPLFSDMLVKELTSLLHWLIIPIYDPLSAMNKISVLNKMEIDSIQEENNSSFFTQFKNYNQLISEITIILSMLKLGLSSDCKLFIKLLQIFNHLYNLENGVYNNTVLSIIKYIFIPSISLVETVTPQLSFDFNSLLEKLPWRDRFKLYDYWLNEMYFSHSALYLKYALVIKDSNRLTNQINKESIKQSSRSLNILISSNPVLSMNVLIKNMINYNNYFESFLLCLQNCNSFVCYDAISFIFSLIINDQSTEKMTNFRVSKYYKKFASIVATFYKKFHSLDYSHIFLCIVNRIKDSILNYPDLVIIREFIYQLSGIVTEEEFKHEHIVSLAGFEKLVIEVMGILKDYKLYQQSSGTLIDLFFNFTLQTTQRHEGNINLLWTILIILASKRENITFAKHEALDTRLISELHDELHNTFLEAWVKLV